MAAPVAVCGLYCQPSPLLANHSRFYPAPVRTVRLFYASPSFAAPQRDEADSLIPLTQAMSTSRRAASHRRPSAIPPSPTLHRAPPAQQSGPANVPFHRQHSLEPQRLRPPAVLCPSRRQPHRAPRPAKRCPYAINVYSVASGSSPLPVRYPRATAASRPARPIDRVTTPSHRRSLPPFRRRRIGSHPRRPHSSAARPLPPI